MIDLDFLSNDYQDNRPVAQKVAESIAIDILTGTLRPGQRISERVLCDKYALSRTPIREILNQLSSTGLVTLIPNRGAFVTGITERDIDDYFYMKNLLYPQCVKWAIERITAEEMSALEETFAFMEFYTATEDLEKMKKINHGFEAIIYNASHNPELERTLLRYDFLILYANKDIGYPLNYLPTVLEEHRAIFRACQEKNTDAGAEAAQIHAYKSMMRRK